MGTKPQLTKLRPWPMLEAGAGASKKLEAKAEATAYKAITN